MPHLRKVISSGLGVYWVGSPVMLSSYGQLATRSPPCMLADNWGNIYKGVLKIAKYSYHKRSVHDHFDERLGLRLDSVVKVGLLHGDKVIKASSHFPAISSYPQQMIVLRGSVIHNLVQVREVSVQINIVGIVSADQIVFGSLLSTIKFQLKSCRWQTLCND